MSYLPFEPRPVVSRRDDDGARGRVTSGFHTAPRYNTFVHGLADQSDSFEFAGERGGRRQSDPHSPGRASRMPRSFAPAPPAARRDANRSRRDQRGLATLRTLIDSTVD